MKKEILFVILLLILFISGCSILEQFQEEQNQEQQQENTEIWIQDGRVIDNLNYSLSVMEKNIHDLINQERVKYNLQELKWNYQIAEVSRKHSQDLANENEILTDSNLLCPEPFIHHEGLIFGLYHDDRLQNSDVFYFNASGENIFAEPIMETGSYKSSEEYDCIYREKFEINEGMTDEQIINTLKQEINARVQEASSKKKVTFTQRTWKTQAEIEEEIVQGWMNSPPHRVNILTAEFNEAGLGISQINNYLFVTQVFITRTSCGFKNGTCCKIEGYLPYCYIPLECKNRRCVD